MNIKEIVEGMTAPQVAQVIKDNFNEVDKDKANKTDLNKSISDLASVVEANKTDLTKKIDNNKEETDEKLSELGSYEFGPTVRYAVEGQQINPPSYQYQDTMSGFETECKEGDVFTLTIVGGSSIRAWATIDANGVVKRVAREYMNGSVTPEIVTIEADEVLFVVNRVNAGGGYVAKTKGEDSIPMLKDKINAHTKEIASNKTEIGANKQSIIELDKYEFTDVVRYAVVGNVLGNPAYQNGSDGFVTECKEGDKFILTIQAGSAFRGWATADANGIVKRVSKEYLNGSVTPVEVTIEKDEVTFIVNRVVAGGGYVRKETGERTIPTIIEQIDTYLDSFNYAYANLSIAIDEKGFVGQKENIQNAPLRDLASLLPNARMMTDDSAHLAFPSILYNSYNKILYLVYRKASAHIATDAQCVYKYSRDNGLTWSNEKIIVNPVKNGDAYGGEILAYPFLLDNGKMMFLSTYYECTENPSGEMDFAIAESYLFKTWIIGTNADGSLDVENAEVYTHDNIKDLGESHLMVGGNGMYVGKTIYVPVYSTIGNTKSFIVKSNDGGKSFEYVGQISNTCNETAINIAGNRMIAVCRDVVDTNNAHFYESIDMGVTWRETHRLDDNWHGMFLQKVFNNFIMIGRGGDLGRSSFVFMDEYGRYLHKPFNIGGYSESGYGAITASYDYYHFVYYTNIGGVTTHPNVYYFRVPKNEIINEILN